MKPATMTFIKMSPLGLAVSMASSFLIGCSDTNTSVPTVQTGAFIDSPVEGINFRTETQSGTTNAAGEFQYLAGESVTFFYRRYRSADCCGGKAYDAFKFGRCSAPIC